MKSNCEKLAAFLAACGWMLLEHKLARLSSLSVAELSGKILPFPSLYTGTGAVVMLVRRLG